ncbi:hypothetical protein SAMN05216570_3183 [Dyella sp. OK004]|uniref:hypothetical protein n=1 Tax=Dyella sp. OK004 TaxID=1855292 RepID=UPI0008ECA50E|nr:hypothetical protein [Dyella sp. OK004]SFS14925.1 hypothetical protein SAMN05216570_3183 [Dyella sp. OK004]
MLDLLSGTLDFGDGNGLHPDTTLEQFERMPVCRTLQLHRNPHVADLLSFHGWQEIAGSLTFKVALSFCAGGVDRLTMSLSNGPMSPFDWDRVTESLLKDEIRVLKGFVRSQLGRPADRSTYPHAPAFGDIWVLPWGELSAHGEPRSFTSGIYLTPNHRIGKAY